MALHKTSPTRDVLSTDVLDAFAHPNVRKRRLMQNASNIKQLVDMETINRVVLAPELAPLDSHIWMHNIVQEVGL